MQIVMHPKVKTFLLTLMAILLVTIVALVVRNLFYSVAVPTALVPPPDQEAAVEGVSAFYTLDYEESPDIWSERVCARSTVKGCEIVKGYFAPQIREMVAKHRIKTGCDVKAVRLVDDKGNTKTWQLLVTLNTPWKGLESASQTVFVEVSLEQGQWLMNRILFNQEIHRLRHLN
jgi:hypothetical protein